MGPYERYMLLDDTAEYPMTFVISIDVSGELQREAFESALSGAIERHPLFGCRVARVPRLGWCWVQVPGAIPKFDWEDSDVLSDCPRGEQIDLTEEIGLRIRVCHAPTRSQVSFQFHHAATDGIGAMHFIGDVLGVYGRLTAAPGEEVPELEPLNPQLLTERGRLWHDGNGPRPGFLSRAAVRVLEMLWQIPSPLAVPRRSLHVHDADLRVPALVNRTFPRDVYKGLKVRAAAKAVTVNDLLVLDMYHSIRDWNRLCGRHDKRAWYRIAIPLSLRTPLEDELPAANVLSFLFMTRRARDCDREDELLSFIHRETESVIQGEDRLIFTFAVRLLLKIPGLLAGLLRVPACQATAILANVGDIRRQFRARFPLKQGRCIAGNVRLKALRGVAPIRHKTRVAVSLGTYAGLLLVNMQCDPRYFARHEAERLADLFAERIRRRSGCDASVVAGWETSRSA